jgi:hypothetical protein
MAIKPATKFKERTPNWKLLNAIRHDASPAYKDMVPLADESSVAATVKAIDKYRPARNEFADALVNQIGLIKFNSDSYFENPYAEFKQGMLEYGDTVEEIGTGLVEEYTFEARENVGEDELFSQEDFEIQSSFHRINRQVKYKITIQREMLRRAFQTEYGISELVARLMDAPGKSNQRDEFQYMANLFKAMDEQDAYYRINTPDVASPLSDDADAKGALRIMRGWAQTLPFLSTKYNPAGLPVSANPEDLILFITPLANAAIDVNGLAGLFNVELGQVPYRVKIVPEEFFPTGVWAILTTRDFFQVYDVLMETATLDNPGGLYQNYWLHVHQVISASRFVPQLAFTTGPGTEDNVIDYTVASVSGIEVYTDQGVPVPAGEELERGRYYQFVSEAITVPAGGPGPVGYAASGFQDARSFLDQRGLFYASPYEKGDVISVTATAVRDDTKATTRVFNLSGTIVSLWNPIGAIPDPEPVDPTA